MREKEGGTITAARPENAGAERTSATRIADWKKNWGPHPGKKKGKGNQLK